MKIIVIFVCWVFIIHSECLGQSDNYLKFTILQRRTFKPINYAMISVKEFGSRAVFTNVSDSNGRLSFRTSFLKGDSGTLSIRVATDTILNLTVYKKKPKGLEITLFVDTDAIWRRHEQAEASIEPRIDKKRQKSDPKNNNQQAMKRAD